MNDGVPDEARLINDAWHIINYDLKWSEPSESEWRQAAKRWRDDYHAWLAYHIYTHPADEDETEKLSIGDLIDALKLVCPCGECTGAWLTRAEAEQVIERLETLALHDRDSSKAR